MEKETERTIDLIDLFFYVIGYWRILLLAGIAGAVLLGGIKLYQSEKSRQSAGYDQTSYEKKLTALQEKEKAVRDLENQINAQNVIVTKQTNNIKSSEASSQVQENKIARAQKNRSFVEDKMEELQKYLDKSIRMNVDATAKLLAKQTYKVGYLKEDEAVLNAYRDPIDEIISVYVAAFECDRYLQELIVKYGVEAEYLRELIAVNKNNEANTITVVATGSSEEMAKDLLQAACAAIEDRTDVIVKEYPAYELKRLFDSYYKVADDELAEEQKTKFTELNNYSSKVADYDNDILTAQKAIDDIKASVADYEAQISKANNTLIDLNNQMESAEKEVKSAEAALKKTKLTRKGNLKASVKQGLIGFVVFAFLAAGVCFLAYLFDGRMHTTADVFGFRPVLAVLSRQKRKKNCFLDRWIYRMRNRGCAVKNEEILKAAAVAVAGMLREEKKIALLSSLDAASAEFVLSGLGTYLPSAELIPISDACTSGCCPEILASADAVILFEKREISRCRDIRAELEKARLMKKKILGCIVA